MKIRFGLRALMSTTAVFAAVFAAVAVWYHAQVTEYQRQLELAQALSEQGTVTWEQRRPTWLQQVGDLKAFQRITAIDCHGTADLNKVLNLAQQLPTLNSIRVCYDKKQWDQGAIQKMTHLTQLKQLVLKSATSSWGGLKEYEYTKSLAAEAEQQAIQLQHQLPNTTVQHRSIECW